MKQGVWHNQRIGSVCAYNFWLIVPVLLEAYLRNFFLTWHHFFLQKSHLVLSLLFEADKYISWNINGHLNFKTTNIFITPRAINNSIILILFSTFILYFPSLSCPILPFAPFYFIFVFIDYHNCEASMLQPSLPWPIVSCLHWQKLSFSLAPRSVSPPTHRVHH
jgi:hypothetical protein